MSCRKLGRTFRAACVLAGGLLLLVLAWTPQNAAQTPTPPCPLATRVPLWVDPVPPQTDRLTETVVVHIGDGDAVTVTCESGVYGVQGSFDTYAHPARVEVALFPLATHHLAVEAHVRRVEKWGCIYGGYTLRTSHDRYGDPLVIRQWSESGSKRYLPLILVSDR